MAIQVTMPQLGESVSEGTVSKWLVKEGDVVTKDQPLIEIATDKADSELPAPGAAGASASCSPQEGDVVSVGTVLCELDESGARPQRRLRPRRRQAAPVVEGSFGCGRTCVRLRRAAPPAATWRRPRARKAALEHSVDLAAVSGSGEHGRIVPDDVLRAQAT